MFNRLNLLLCASVFLFLAACAGSKGGGSSSYDDDEGGGSNAPVKVNELNEAHKEAVSLTEENHKLAKEAFDLKNKLGLSPDED